MRRGFLVPSFRPATAAVTFLLLLSGGLLAGLHASALWSPESSLNTVASVRSTYGASATLELAPSNYTVVWRTNMPSSDSRATWTISVSLADAAGTVVFARSQTLQDEVTCYERYDSDGYYAGESCSSSPAHNLGSFGWLGGSLTANVVVNGFSSTLSARPPAALGFNDPVARGAHNGRMAIVGVALSFAWYPILIAAEALQIRRERNRPPASGGDHLVVAREVKGAPWRRRERGQAPPPPRGGPPG